MPALSPMPSLPNVLCLAATDVVKHRVSSALLEGFSQWWQMPLLVAVLVAVTAWVAWMYRRDAAELPRGIGLLLLGLRLGALATLAAAYFDLERIAEHEVVFPSRVAVVVDASASMTLPEGLDAGVAVTDAVPSTRSTRAVEVLQRGGMLAALAPTHEVSLWRFDADAESLTVLPRSTEENAAADGAAEPDWPERLQPRGFETRIGEALVRVIDQEPPGTLAGVIPVSYTHLTLPTIYSV